MGRDFNILFIVNALLYMGLQMANSILPKQAEELGASAGAIGMVMGCFAVAALALKVISGPALDSFNRKAILGIAMLGMAISYIGYAFAPSVETLALFSLIRGGCQAFTATACLVMAPDCLSEDKMMQGVSVLSLAYAVCQAVGPAAALAISSAIGLRATFAIGATLEVVGAGLLFLINRKSCGSKSFAIRLDSVITRESIPCAIIIGLLNGASFIAMSFCAMHGMSIGVSQEHVGLYFTVYSIALIALRPLVTKSIDGPRFKRTLALTLSMYAASFLMLSQASDLRGILAAGFIAGIGYSAGHPAIQALALRLTPPEKRSAAAVTCYIGNDLGSFLMPMGAGVVADLFNYETMWVLAACPVVIAIALIRALPLKPGSYERGPTGT